MKWKRLLLMASIVLLTVSITWAVVTYKYVYPAETVQAETNGYGGAVADLAADQAYDYTSDIDLETDGYYGVWVTLEFDSAGTTDNIIISYFGSYDGTNFDDVPLYSFEPDDNGGADTQVSFLLYPCPPHGRIGVKTSGTTDTFDYQITTLPARGVDDSS